MLGRLCVGLLCLGFTLSAAAQGEVEKEMKKLQGSWKVVGAQVDSVKIPLEAFKKVVVEFKDDKIFFKEDGKTYDEIEFDIDPAAKPKEIDYLYTTGLKKGIRERGVYELVGEQLTICIAQPKQKRPTEIGSKKGTGQQLLVLKRIK